MNSESNAQALNRREFLRQTAIGATAVAASGVLSASRRASAAETPKRRPNILFIITDDPKYADALKEMKGRLKEWLATFDRPFAEFTK
jgi:hypothetical protein